MPILLSHPTGNANVRHALTGLWEAGLLEEFHTSVASFPGNGWDWVSRFPGGKEFKRRAFDPRLKAITRQHPFRDLGRMIGKRLGVRFLVQRETGLFSVDSVYRSLDKIVSTRLGSASNRFSGVYAYDDGALQTFQQAKALGKICFFDLPTPHWRTVRRLLEKERTQRPEWAVTMGSFHDSEIKLARKDEELRLADVIFAATPFVADSLTAFPEKLEDRVKIIPYGFPPASVSACKKEINLSRSRPLKILYVGKLSQDKGLACLLEAVEPLQGKIELTLVGHKTSEDCAPLNNALQRHRWIPTLPNSAILKLMGEYDLFVFPSLYEGFGLVIAEAMSQGLPVITTDRTAGAAFIREGENGWLVPAGDSESIRRKIEAILLAPSLLEKVSQAALETASRRPWSAYGRELAEAIQGHLTTSKLATSL